MATYSFGCLFLIGVGLASSAAAQKAASPKLAAIVLSEKKAASSPPVAAPTAVAAPLFSPDSVFVNPEVRPQFTGGSDAFSAYLKKNLQYSAESKRQHLSGTVVVSFVLSASGLVTYATVLHGTSKVLNEEALRLVWHMPPWQPARQHGQPVRVSCAIPINFAE